MRALVITGLFLLGSVGTTAAQSFDCAKAQTAVEKVVCSDSQLRELDEHLGRYYAGGRLALGTPASCLQTDQSQWLKSTRDACRDVACLRRVYLNRLAELDALQPGAIAVGHIALPAVPSLAWVIGPAADRVAAPANPKAAPFEASGAIVDEVANGDGFMLRTADGARVPIVLLMFMEGATADRLAAMAREKDARFVVRGYAASDGGRKYFEPSRCTFIYRTPAAAARSQARPPAEEQELEKVRTRVVVQGKVCPDPARPCEGFKPNELSFAIGQPFAFDRGRDRSQPFYAVILTSGPLCGVDDRERVQAQARFPNAKVFLHRYMCEDFGDKVTYSNINAKSGFVAVYAGEAEADARKVLAQAKALGYAGANLRRMEAIVVYQIE